MGFAIRGHENLTPEASSEIHYSAWNYAGDYHENNDLRILAVSPYGVWMSIRLNAAASGFGPNVNVNGTPIGWDRTHYGGYNELNGDAGDWSRPFYIDDLEPNTAYTITVDQVSGGTTDSLSITTRTVTKPTPQDFGISDTVRNELRTSGVDANWLAAIRAQGSSFTNDNQGAQRVIPAAMMYAITELTSDRDQALALWQNALDARAGTWGPSGSEHRWRGNYLSVATGILANEGQLTALQIETACDAMIDDLEANQIIYDGDTDKNISYTKIGIIASTLGLAYLPSGTLRDRYQASYDFYHRQMHAILLPMMRMDNLRAVSGGGVQDSSDYMIGTITYWMDLVWYLEQVNPTLLDDYIPYLVNAAYTQAHEVVPDGGSRFSRGSVEGGDIAESASTNPAQYDTRIFLAWILHRHGETDAANHMRWLLDHYAVTSDYDYMAALANDNQRGSGRLRTIFVNSSGSAAAVYARTGWGSGTWTTSESAIVVQAGGRWAHHAHADVAHVGWHHAGAWKLRENPGYLSPANTDAYHNVPPGQPTGQGAQQGQADISSVTTDGTTITITLNIQDVYTVDFLRRVTWDTATPELLIEDIGSGAPVQNTWIGDTGSVVVDTGTPGTNSYTVT